MTLPAQGLGKSPGPASATTRQTILRLLRRTHLYLGLLMWPFVLLFAITGLSFNHPTVGRGLTVKRASSAEVARATGFQPWDPAAMAAEVVKELRKSGQAYRLSSSVDARFAGFPLFAAPTADGKQALIISLSDGQATITERPDPPESAPTPFADAEIHLPAHDLKALAAKLTPLLAAQGVTTKGPLAPHPRVHPELAFRLLDASGKEWNVVYDLGSGKLTGKPTATPRAGVFVELLESIHTQHHYPPHPSATLFWALFADLTAITLLIWAVTGIVMWWQMRRLRLAGAVVIVLALGAAASVMIATGSELSFTPRADE